MAEGKKGANTTKIDTPLCCIVNPYLGCIGCDIRVCIYHYQSFQLISKECLTTYYNGWAHDAYGHAWNNIWQLPLNRETELRAKQRGEPILRRARSN